MAPKLRKSNYWLAWPSGLRRTEKRRVAAASKLAAADHRKDTAYVGVRQPPVLLTHELTSGAWPTTIE
jgi:hypothetical protein